MPESLLLGVEDDLRRVDAGPWRQHLLHLADKRHTRRALVSPLHRRVREFVVRELPRHQAPLELQTIARALDLPDPTVHVLLEDLERDLFFLVRDSLGHVNWAFPCTVEPTPHRLAFSTGERTYAA
jgi:hypothetical protein